MKSRIISSSYVVDFLDVNFDSKAIEKGTKNKIDAILNNVKDNKLNDWELHFIFRYNTVKQLLIYTRGKSYSKEKYKEVTIHIPIPSIDVVTWGVNKDQEVYEENHLDKMINNFDHLNVDFKSYPNRTEYLTDCMLKAIKHCLESGVTVNGIKVKIPVSPDL